jgi:hypothetical protein
MRAQDEKAIAEMPAVVVSIGDVVLFDLDKLFEDKNSSLSDSIDDTSKDLGIDAQRYKDAADFISSEDAYLNKYLIFLVICVAMLLLILLTKWGGCLEGRGSEMLHDLTIGLIGGVQGSVTIPLYTHLLSGLDCTYRASGMGPNKNSSGFEWDQALEAFGRVDDGRVAAEVATTYSERECFGSFTNVFDGGWTAFNFMVFGMVGVCLFQWPITLFLMVRPDSERDDQVAVEMILDAIIVKKRAPGRMVTKEPGAEAVPSFEPLWQKKKSNCCCRLRRNKGYERATVTYEGSEANDGIETAREVKHKLLGRRDSSGRAVPAYSRLKLRDYAVRMDVQPDEIWQIDHRRACLRTRDLDHPTEGISGPRKRPREAAVNFGRLTWLHPAPLCPHKTKCVVYLILDFA